MPRRRRATKKRTRTRIRSSVPPYPGHYLKEGSTDRDSTRLVQERLNQVHCGPVAEDGRFDSETTAAVQLFQARSVDSRGQALTIDGIVGPLTWGALFGPDSLPDGIGEAVSPLVKSTVIIARTQIGVREDPVGSNRGPEVDAYIRSVGLDPEDDSYPWCAAFIYWSFQEAADSVGRENPAIQTAGVLDHWKKAGRKGITRLSPGQIEEDFSLLRSGMLFVISTGQGKGHMGIVEGFRDGCLVTIEGNTNFSGGREGVGVFRRTSRKLTDINTGFISYDT
jgi:hypothetical protein